MAQHKRAYIQCPACGGKYFKTTRQYSTRKKATGRMIQMLKKFKKLAWPAPAPHARQGELICPNCEAGLLDKDGNFKLGGLV